MSITIGSNIASLQAQRRLTDTTDSFSRTIERLSSGLRINRASDDAAGLSVAQSLNLNSRVFAQGIRNISDGISALSITEGALDSLGNVLVRQKELATQAANGTFSLTQRRSLQAESDALMNEYNRIIQSTSFNGISLLNGVSRLGIQFGFGNDATIAVSFGDSISRASFASTGFSSSTYSATGYKFDSGDVNGDGNADLVRIVDANNFGVTLGNGDGTFGAEVSLALTFAISTSNAAVPKISDVNNDGRNDIVLADNNTGNLVVVIGNGDGTFRAAQSFASSVSKVNELGLFDFNGDGNLDVLSAASKSSGNSSILIGNGDGTFRAGMSFTNTADYTITGTTSVGDINLDGKLDIVMTDDVGGFRIQLGNGDGTFSTSVSQATVNDGVLLMDTNRDGCLDLIGIDTDTGALTMQLGNGNGTFRALTTISTSAGASNALGISDMNLDGIQDFYTLSASGFSLYFGNGDGTFKARQTFGGFSSLTYAEIGDFNNDGVLDVMGCHLPGGTKKFISRTRQITTAPLLTLTSQAEARTSLGFVDDLMKRLALERASLGAASSRLGSALRTSSTAEVNYKAAEGRIVDADIAQETAQATKAQVLQRVGASVLAQANIQPQIALKLLTG